MDFCWIQPSFGDQLLPGLIGAPPQVAQLWQVARRVMGLEKQGLRLFVLGDQLHGGTARCIAVKPL